LAFLSPVGFRVDEFVEEIDQQRFVELGAEEFF
jgi:hypothetical protein